MSNVDSFDNLRSALSSVAADVRVSRMGDGERSEDLEDAFETAKDVKNGLVLRKNGGSQEPLIYAAVLHEYNRNIPRIDIDPNAGYFTS